MQDIGLLSVLKERYRFDEWKDARSEVPSQRREPPALSGSEFPGWRLARQSRRAPAVTGVRSFLRSTWQGATPDRLLSVDLYECDTAAAARETLLRQLAEFQGPPLTALPGIGDVAFAMPGETAIVFARGHVVAALRNAGRSVEPLGNEARILDELISPRGGEPRGRRARPA
jgi:hypothetical protein